MIQASFLDELYSGRIRWDLIHPFPVPAPAMRAAVGDAVRLVDDLEISQSDEPPPRRVLAQVAGRGFTKAGLGHEVGGLGLSPWGVLRVVMAILTRNFSAGMVVAAENAFGLSALLPRLPPGPLHAIVSERIRAGAFSGMADTEPHGGANLGRRTTGIESGSGRDLVLSGEKLVVSNAPIADVLLVSATIAGRRRLLVVDADSPGVLITEQRFMGLAGFPIGRVVLQRVVVPRERQVPGRDEPGAQITAEATEMVRTGKVYFTAAPSLVLARRLLGWAAEYIAARSVDGRGLAEFDETSRRLAESAADVYALEAAMDWALLTSGTVPGARAWIERSALKNTASALAGRVAERLFPLLAGEGYETAASKAARGAQRQVAAERAIRDLLAFRIAGGVDFQIDDVFAKSFILPRYEKQDSDCDDDAPLTAKIPAAFTEQASFLTDRARKFACLCREVVRECGGHVPGHDRQRRPILLNQLATELMTASLVIARAARLSEPAADLAEIYLDGASRRIDGLISSLICPPGPVPGAAIRRLLTQFVAESV